MLDSAVVLEFNRAREAEDKPLLAAAVVDDAGGGDVTLIGDSEWVREILTDFAVGGSSAEVGSRC